MKTPSRLLVVNSVYGINQIYNQYLSYSQILKKGKDQKE